MTLNPQQFVRVFRGLSGVEPDQVDYEKLGMHWSTNAHVASDFTRGQGSIIEGKVNKQHLMTPDHPDWKEFQVRYQVFGPNSKEQEHTVLSGSPVDITQVHHVYDEDEEPLAFKPNESYDELSRKLPKRGTAQLPAPLDNPNLYNGQMPAPDGPQFKMYSARELLKKYSPNKLEHAMGESTEELLNRKLDESVKSGLYGDIRKNGITTPVSVSTRIDNPQILDGHHRVAVMLNLSPDEVSIPVTAPPRNRSAFSERLHTDELQSTTPVIHEFQQPLEVSTPLGDGVALLLIDYGWGANSCWVVVLESGIVKHFESNDIRFRPNPTWGILK